MSRCLTCDRCSVSDNSRHAAIADAITWSEETRKVAATDAQRVLEALIAEHAVLIAEG
jgi:hypothetical protein